MGWSWCFIRNVLNIDCPGCGLGRSVLHLLQGHFAESIALHPMGVVIVLGALNFWWWRRVALTDFSRRLVSHGLLAGFLIPWMFGFFI